MRSLTFLLLFCATRLAVSAPILVIKTPEGVNSVSLRFISADGTIVAQYDSQRTRPGEVWQAAAGWYRGPGSYSAIGVIEAHGDSRLLGRTFVVADSDQRIDWNSWSWEIPSPPERRPTERNSHLPEAEQPGVLAAAGANGAAAPATTVEDCVAAGKANPRFFSPKLIGCLSELDREVVLKGLRYRDERPAVAQRVHETTTLVLCAIVRHNKRSARRLLEFLIQWPDGVWPDVDRDVLREVCFRYVAKQPVVRAAMKEAIATQPRGLVRAELMKAIVLETPSRSPDARLVARYEREVQAIEQEESLPEHLIARIASNVAEGWVPGPRDVEQLSQLVGTNKKASALFSDLLASPAREVRAAAFQFLAVTSFPDMSAEERARLSQLILEEDVLRGGDWGLQQDLVELAKPLAPDEATGLFAMADQYLTGPAGKLAGGLMIALADRLPALRPEVLAKLLGSDPRTSVSLFDHRVGWIKDAALSWLRTVSDEQLRNDAAQEQFVVFAPALPGWDGSPAWFPETRLAHPRTYLPSCGTGMFESFWDSFGPWRDLTAFGLPAGERPGSSPTEWVPAAPPMTPMETAMRWQQIVFARQVVLAKMEAAMAVPPPSRGTDRPSSGPVIIPLPDPTEPP